MLWGILAFYIRHKVDVTVEYASVIMSEQRFGGDFRRMKMSDVLTIIVQTRAETVYDGVENFTSHTHDDADRSLREWRTYSFTTNAACSGESRRNSIIASWRSLNVKVAQVDDVRLCRSLDVDILYCFHYAVYILYIGSEGISCSLIVSSAAGACIDVHS